MTTAGIVLTCCLAIYSVAAPLMVHSGPVGGRLIATVVLAAAAAVVVLAALVYLRRSLAAHREGLVVTREELAQTRDELAQTRKELAHTRTELTRTREERTRQANRIDSFNEEVDTLKTKVAEATEREWKLRGEIADLRETSKKNLEEQTRTVNDAVRYTLHERVPPAILGQALPPAASGIDSELAELLEEAVEIAGTGADQQQSMRSAVVAMARRVQASAHRIQEEAALMADRHPGNADVLEVSMRVDHASAQQARTAQSLAVLLGEWPGQQWPEPLPLVDVVRAASGRIIAYRRVEVAGDQDIAASPPAVEPLIHLVAELLANATQSSPPTTQVPVTVRAVQRGAVIEVHDCGVGLDDYRLEQARATATGKRRIGLEHLGEFPQTGLAVVGQYARRHGFRIDISESVYGGIRAIVGIPLDLTETVAPVDSIPSQTRPAHEATSTAAGTLSPVPAESLTPAASPVPSASTAPAGTAPGADTTEASTETDTVPDSGSAPTTEQPLTRRSGLPRRVSPRHDPAAHTGSQAGGSPVDAQANSHADPGTGPLPVRGAVPVQETQVPTPEEAGAWMGAFLTSPGAGPQPGDPGVARETGETRTDSGDDSIASEDDSHVSEDNSTGQQE